MSLYVRRLGAVLVVYILFLLAQAQTCAAQGTQKAVVPTFLPVEGHTFRYEPFPWYQDWWNELEKCAGAHSPMSDWMFVAVTTDAFTMWDDSSKTLLIGATRFDNHRLYYVRAHINMRSRVQHEMLHALLHGAGRPSNHGTTADSLFDKCNYR